MENYMKLSFSSFCVINSICAESGQSYTFMIKAFVNVKIVRLRCSSLMPGCERPIVSQQNKVTSALSLERGKDGLGEPQAFRVTCHTFISWTLRANQEELKLTSCCLSVL